MSSAEREQKDAILVEKQEMVDITSLIEDAASSLKVSDPMLCNKKSFNLQDSMAALELMDRKMDCCEVPASLVAPYGKTASEEKMVFPRPAPTNLDDAVDPLPWDDLTMEDAAFISLEALIRLESLLDGSSVVESTFTCLYAHQPVMADMKARLQPDSKEQNGTIAQRVVFAATLMLLELTDVLRSIILNADIYEEEDFSVSTFNIAVYDDREEDTAIVAVADALELMKTLEEQDNDDVRAITLILGFQLDFLTVCTSMARLAGRTVTKVVEESQTLIRTALQKLEVILVVAKRMKENESDRAKEIIQRTFDSYVNRPLVGNAPVRKIIFHEAQKSIGLLVTITKEIDWALCGLLNRGNTLARIRRMLSRISISSANILTRSLIVLNLYFDDKVFGQYGLTSLIVKHMQQLSHIPDSVFAGPCAKAFLNRLAKPIYDTLKVMTLNRNRQRSYIEAVMFHDWASLQQEAHLVDVTHRKESAANATEPPHFSLYILFATVDLMDHFVGLGIELGLFCGEHELAVAYWYRDFLLSSLLNQLSSLRRAKLAAKTEEREQAEAAAKSHRGKKKGGKHHVKKATNGYAKTEDTSLTPESVEDEFDFQLLGLKRELCRGIVRFIAATNQAGLVKEKYFEFTSKDRVFEKRFEAFASIQQPPPLFYDDFLEGSDFSKVQQNVLLTSTSECFKVSKGVVDTLLSQLSDIDPEYLPMQEEELKRLAKVCIGNSVYVQKLRQKVDATGKATGELSFDLETHNQFCTTKLN